MSSHFTSGSYFTELHDLVTNVYVELTGLSFEDCKYHGLGYDTWMPGPDSGISDPKGVKPTEEAFNELFNKKSAENPEFAMNMLRYRRDMLLEQSDFALTADYPHSSPENEQAWKDYRTALRNLTDVSQPTFTADDITKVEPSNVVWPTRPSP